MIRTYNVTNPNCNHDGRLEAFYPQALTFLSKGYLANTIVNAGFSGYLRHSQSVQI